MRHLLAVAALVVLAAGCNPWPRVKPERLNPRPKLAVVSFQSEPLSGGAMAIRMQVPVEALDAAHALFAGHLGDAGFEVVPVESVRNCSFYHRLPQPKVDKGTTATGLARVQLTHREVHGLASCSGAEISVAVYLWPKTDTGLHVGIGRGRVEMLTHVLAWDDNGREVWRDRLAVFSEPFPLTASVVGRAEIEALAHKAASEAAKQAVTRLAERLVKSPNVSPGLTATPPPPDGQSPEPAPEEQP